MGVETRAQLTAGEAKLKAVSEEDPVGSRLTKMEEMIEEQNQEIDRKFSEMLEAIRSNRFEKVLDDPVAELKQLKETNGIVEYHKKFELLSTRVNLTEDYLVRIYLDGLQIDTQVNVQMFQPQTIHQCFLIGKFYEYAHPRSNIDNVGILPLKRDGELKAEEDNEEEEIEVEMESIGLEDNLVNGAILEEESTPQFQEWSQKNIHKIFEVDGDVEKSQNVVSNTKLCFAHQMFGKMSQQKERLGIKKKRKGFKSWMFKYRRSFKKLHTLIFSTSMRMVVSQQMDMVETTSDLLLLNGKGNPPRTALGSELEAVETDSSNLERSRLCTEYKEEVKGCLESLQASILMKAEPESVKVNKVKLETQTCHLKSDLIQAKMIVTKTNSLCNDESVYAPEDFSFAVLEENQSQIYYGIDGDAFHSGCVFRFWKFTCYGIIPLGRTVLTTGRKKTFYRSRRFKFKHKVAPRDFKSGFEVKGKQTAMWQQKANKEYLCLIWTSNVAVRDHTFLVGEMKLNGYKLFCQLLLSVINKKQQRKPPKYPTTWKFRFKNLNLQRNMIHLDTQLFIFRWDSMYIRHLTTFEHHLEDSHPQSGFDVKGDVKYKYPCSSAKVALMKKNKFSKTWFMLKGDCFKEDDQVCHETLPIWLLTGFKFGKFRFGNMNLQKARPQIEAVMAEDHQKQQGDSKPNDTKFFATFDQYIRKGWSVSADLDTENNQPTLRFSIWVIQNRLRQYMVLLVTHVAYATHFFVGVDMDKKQSRLPLRTNRVWDPGGFLVEDATETT